MKINSIHSRNYNRQNFGARLTKDVQRGFDNLGYRIKRDFGVNSDEYIKYENHMQELKENCEDYILDSNFDPMPKTNDEWGVFPYTFMLSAREKGKKDFFDVIREIKEDDLYTMYNLNSLAKSMEKISK